MSPEKTQKLLDDFPILFRQYYWPATRTCMCWGFSCGDGWFDLIYECAKKITLLSKKLPTGCACGHSRLYHDREFRGRPSSISVCIKCPHSKFGGCSSFRRREVDAIYNPPAAAQVKEKFGTLRFYMDGRTEEIAAVIKEAERKSSLTCETCGNPGTLGRSGSDWTSVSCTPCSLKK